MPTVIPVKFAYATRELWFNPAETGAVEGDHVICSTERGTEIGLATTDPMEVDKAELNRRTDGAALKRVIRVATDSDLELAERLASKGEAALPTFRKLVSESDLDMKPVGVEYIFGGEKCVCYFAAEERVDFRQLVRDLSRTLHERVDMRQIGVREEAALMGGFAHCGQELCCSRFGSGFEPVSIRMAKEQDLPLNSNKISGACGRLMCCLRYEFEAYRDFKQRAPKKNAVIQTPLGTAKIIEYDTPKEQLCLRLESGKQIRVPLAEMEASPAAHKKSEELGCACRPDTVLRSTLERLQSPEIRAALEEIDRKNGLIPQETYEPSDLFVEERGGRKRRNKGGNKGGNGSGSAQGQGSRQQGGQQKAGQRSGGFAGVRIGEGGADAAASGEQGETKRRRRRKTVEISEEQAALLPGVSGAEANVSAPGEGRRSRRRRHHSEEGAGESGQRQPREARDQQHEGRGQQEGGQRRRRGGEGRGERQAERERAGQQTERGERRAGAGEQAEESPRRRRRRPGDRGGAPGEIAREGCDGDRREGRGEGARERQGEGQREARGEGQRQRPTQPGRPRHMREPGAPSGEQGSAPSGDEAPKRRRRRHRRPGDGGGSEGAATSND